MYVYRTSRLTGSRFSGDRGTGFVKIAHLGIQLGLMLNDIGVVVQQILDESSIFHLQNRKPLRSQQLHSGVTHFLMR